MKQNGTGWDEMESVKTRRKLIGRCGKGRGTMTEGRTVLNWMELCGTGQNVTGEGMTGWDTVEMHTWPIKGHLLENFFFSNILKLWS